MIPSIDTYLYKQIEDKLKIILTNRYIIEEILSEMDSTIADRFMLAYTGEGAREIPIVYTMPQEKVHLQGAIFIGLKTGEETDPSIGHHEGTYPFESGGFKKEPSTAIREGDRLYFEVSETIGELNNVEKIEFARDDNVTIEGKRIYFTYDPIIEGEQFEVNYLASKGDKVGITKGFTALEYYSVLSVSTNMNTVRCLDMILRAIFILMRDNPEEQRNHLLQKLQFGQIEEINIGDGPTTPEMLFGREIVVSYKTSYGLDSPLTTKLEEILITERVGDING